MVRHHLSSMYIHAACPVHLKLHCNRSCCVSDVPRRTIHDSIQSCWLICPPHDSCSIIHTDLKPENVLLDLPPRPPPEAEQPPPLPGKLARAGFQGVATTIDDLSAALAMADAHGLSAEEKRKLKKKVH